MRQGKGVEPLPFLLLPEPGSYALSGSLPPRGSSCDGARDLLHVMVVLGHIVFKVILRVGKVH